MPRMEDEPSVVLSVNWTKYSVILIISPARSVRSARQHSHQGQDVPIDLPPDPIRLLRVDLAVKARDERGGLVGVGQGDLVLLNVGTTDLDVPWMRGEHRRRGHLEVLFVLDCGHGEEGDDVRDASGCCERYPAVRWALVSGSVNGG
jgi:hypothetical protein